MSLRTGKKYTGTQKKSQTTVQQQVNERQLVDTEQSLENNNPPEAENNVPQVHDNEPPQKDDNDPAQADDKSVKSECTPSHQSSRSSHHSSRSSHHSSRSSHYSSRSSMSATKAQAKAKAAHAKLAFAEKEAAIIKMKADLEASLHILKSQKDAAAASAEAAAYEESEDDDSGEYMIIKPLLPQEPLIKAQRTSEYIQRHSQMFKQSPSNDQPQAAPKKVEKLNTGPVNHHVALTNKQHGIRDTEPIKQEKGNENPQQHLPDPQSAPDLAKYLIRREMVSSGLLKFDDRPENYWSWKASFVSATKDLNLSDREELDLLAKWLGTDSAEQAMRIRSVHVHNPSAGLIMVWQRLEECYGAAEVIEHALLKKIEDFPKLSNKDNVKLRELGDILLELQGAKEDGYLTGLSFLDTARGVNPIVEKLPYNLQERWMAHGSQYKEEHNVAFPPFSVFATFIRRQARIRNDPCFILTTSSSHTAYTSEKHSKNSNRASVSVHKTDVQPESSDECSEECSDPVRKKMDGPDRLCPIHKKPHPLKKCRSFRGKTMEERKAYLKENRICYRCCGSTRHVAKDCKATIKCLECDSDRHIAALHPGPPPSSTDSGEEGKEDSQQEKESLLEESSVTNKCTEICGTENASRSCAKICLVKVYPAGEKEKATKMYAVLDEQSNKSLAKAEFFNLFRVKANSSPYTLKTCSGTKETSGRRAANFIIESVDGKLQIPLPTLIECDLMPDDRMEIPSPEIARHHPHLLPIANKITAVDPDAPILLLLGRDLLRVHKVREQIDGPHNAPFAQRLDLGWVIIGEACLGTVHKPAAVNVYKANVLQNKRTSFLNPCPNSILVKEDYSGMMQQHSLVSSVCDEDEGLTMSTDSLGCSVFEKSKDDDKPALSMEDKAFLSIMDEQVYQNDSNSWVAPLPFRSPRRRLPINKQQAVKRLSSLRRTLERRPKMRDHYMDFMQRMLDNDQAKVAPPLEDGREHWYPPTFGVYHPQKPDQIRVVFDSSVECDGVSLNSVLLSGPDLNNTLLGVLLRFQKEPIALTVNVQQMFYCFVVREDHRDYLRYLWYEDNDIT